MPNKPLTSVARHVWRDRGSPHTCAAKVYSVADKIWPLQWGPSHRICSGFSGLLWGESQRAIAEAYLHGLISFGLGEGSKAEDSLSPYIPRNIWRKSNSKCQEAEAPKLVRASSELTSPGRTRQNLLARRASQIQCS